MLLLKEKQWLLCLQMLGSFFILVLDKNTLLLPNGPNVKHFLVLFKFFDTKNNKLTYQNLGIIIMVNQTISHMFRLNMIFLSTCQLLPGDLI